MTKEEPTGKDTVEFVEEYILLSNCACPDCGKSHGAMDKEPDNVIDPETLGVHSRSDWDVQMTVCELVMMDNPVVVRRVLSQFESEYPDTVDFIRTDVFGWNTPRSRVVSPPKG